MDEANQPRNRLYTVMALVLIAAGVALMAVSLVRVQQSILAQERNQMLLIAKSTARSVENYIQGTITGIILTQSAPSFRKAAEEYRARGATAPLMEHLRRLASDEHPAVTDVCLMDRDSRPLLWSAESDAYESIGEESGRPGDGRLRIYRNKAGNVFLGVVTTLDNENFLLNLLDVERLYQRTASFAALGENGYVMFKHSRGLILTHPVRGQVGADVIEGRERVYPDLDYADLERLIANQEMGKEGIETYYSYWWAESPPRRVKKISAYTPVRVQNDFLIVSAVADYAELLMPIQVNSVIQATAAVLASLGVMALLFRYRRESQRKIKRENQYLKELNRSLDEMARRQEEMRHHQRLQMIGTLTGGIAHEFRNLLTPIMGYSGLLRESLPPDSPMREDIEEIYGSAVKAKEIIQQITSLSRKNLEPEFKPVRLDNVLPGILKMAVSGKPADFEIVTRIDFGGEYIMGDKTQISQIVLNLCNNAFQAKPDGKGHLWIDGEMADEGAGRFAVLRFRDDGAGIPPETLPRIFDPFFTTKRVGEGTGLGLSVVQNIVDLHKGTIAVESAPDAGTIFTIRFPAIRPEESRRLAAVPAPRAADDVIDVVLVEDDEAVLRVLKRGLEKSGFATRAFTDPAEALKEMEKNPSRLLVTDFTMPGMNGGELAKKARQIFPNVKIIILTGFADRDILDYLKQDIIDSYQIKPVPISELVEKINGLFVE